MRHRTLTTALLVSVLMLASAGPANALFDIGGVIQRAQMIVNQATQIANQIRQMRTMTRQLTELEEQLDYMKEVARGEVDGLIEPFAELAAGSIGLVGDGLGWGSEFTGAAGELVEAVRDMGSGSSFTDVWRSAQGVADQVSEADILELFRNHPAEASSRAVEDYRQAKETADRQRVLDYAMMDAAASLASTVESAQSSFDDLTANGNLSNTALQQAQVAAALTQGRINAAVAQVLAYQAVEQANRMQQAEIDRLERLAEWRDARLRTNAMADAMRARPRSRTATGSGKGSCSRSRRSTWAAKFRPRERLSCNSCHLSRSIRTSRPRSRRISSRTSRGSWTSCSIPWSAARRPTCSRSATSSGAVSRRSSSPGAASRSRSAEPSSRGPSCVSCSGSRSPGRCSITTASRSRASGFTFPAMVAAGGIWLQNLFISDVVSVGYTEMTALVQAFAARLGAAWSGGSLMTLMTEGVSVFFSSLVALMMGVPLVLGLVALFCLTYAQVIWAQVALAIVILLGPRVHPLAALRAARVPVLGMVPHAHGLHALRRRGRSHPEGLHGRGHGLRHDLYRCLDGHRLLRPGRARALGRRPPPARRLRPDGRHEGGRARRDARLRFRVRRIGVHGARGARRRAPQRCREPGPPPNPRRLKETSMNREHDAGREYAEIWGETVEANRKLRTLAMILAAACLALAVLLLRVATVEPPRPIVVRVDEVGRAEAVAYEAATAQADPLDPTTKYFLNRFISDFYSQAAGHGRGALDAEPPVPLDRAGERRVHARRRRGRRHGRGHRRHRAPGRAGRAPHPPRTGGAARRDRRLRPGPPPAGAGDAEGAVVDHAPVHVPLRHPLRARRLQPDGHPHHLPPGRPCPGHGAAQR